MKVLTRFLLVLVGLGFMAPLVYWFGIFGLPVWSLPFAALLCVQGGRAIVRGKYRFARPDLFEGAVVVFVAMMTLSTLLNPSEAELGANKLFVYFLALGLAVYVKRHFGTTVTVHRLVIFAYLLVGIQFVVCMAQYVTQSAIGDVGAYFGTTQVEDLEKGLVQAALGIGRVVGTLGGSPNLLGRAIVVFLPFLAISGAVFPRLKNRPLHYIGQRITIAMAVIVVLLTVSRSSIAVLFLLAVVAALRRVGGLLHVMAWFYSTRQRFVSASLLVLLVGAGVGAAFSNTQFRESLRESVQTVKLRMEQINAVAPDAATVTAGPLETRYRLNIGAIRMFTDSPIVLGKGYRNSKRVAVKTDIQNVMNKESRVHNAYFQYLAEGGAFALLSFLILTIYPFYLNVQFYRGGDAINSAFLASMGSILLFMQTSTTYDSAALAPLYMLIIGSAVAYGARDTETDSETTL